MSLHAPLDQVDLDEFTRVLDLNIVSVLTAVARKELEPGGITVSLVVPSITATEFDRGRFQAGQAPRPGLVAHSAEYVGKVILRALRTGEERIDIPHGPEQPQLTTIPETERGRPV